MRTALALLLLMAPLSAQQTFNYVQIKRPTPTSGGTGRIDFFNDANTFRVRVQAGAALGQNLTFRFPTISDNAGDCLVSSGSGTWNPGSCGGSGAPPVSWSLNSAGDVLTLAQTGSGRALRVNGKASFSSQTDGDEFRANKFTFLNSGLPEWFMSDATSNRLSWTDSGGVQRMWLDGTGAGGAGPYLQTPALFAQSVVTTDNTFQVAAIPSQTGALVDVTDSGRTTHYFKISAAGVPSGTHFQSLGSADNPTFGNLTVSSCTGCGSPTPPITYSGTTSSPTAILTIAQSGTGQGVAITSNAGSGLTAISNSTGPAVLGTNNGGINSIGVKGFSSSGYGVYADGSIGLYATGTLSAEFATQAQFDAGMYVQAGTSTFNGSLAGTHAQNVGSTDNPTFGTLTVTSCTGCGVATPPITYSASSASTILTLTNSGAGNALTVTGPVTGNHLQNLGSADNPTFGNLTVSSCTGCGSPTPPITYSASSASTILTLTNSGAGNALTVTGPVTGNHLQNLGTSDNPTFGSLTVTSCTGCGGVGTVTGGSNITVTGSPNYTVALNSISLNTSSFGTGNIIDVSNTAATTTGLSRAFRGVSSRGTAAYFESDGSSAGGGGFSDCNGGCALELYFNAPTGGTSALLGKGLYVHTGTSKGYAIEADASNASRSALYASNLAGGGSAYFDGNVTINSGGLTITAGGCTGCVTIPGANQQLIFNSSGALGASNALTWNGGILTASFVSTGGLTVTSTGVDVTGASTFRTGIQLLAGSFVQSGSFAIYSGSGGFAYMTSANLGVTGTTCSQFKGGICTAL